MVKWSVKLEGKDYDLQYLEKKFNSPILTIIKDNNAYYLKSDSFEVLEDDFEVRLKASELIEKINMILKFDLGVYSLKIGEIARIDGKKSNKRSSSLKCIMRILDSERIDVDYDSLIKCIYKNEKVEDAIIFYFLDSNWINLYKVWETIVYDIGCAKMGKEGRYRKIVEHGTDEIIKNLEWAKEKEINLFGCTAHNRKGAGLDAHHAVEEGINPHCKKILSSTKPMPLGVAQKLIKRILNNWINTKCK
jgi:hypothetical protein